jgi:hypothetical protein
VATPFSSTRERLLDPYRLGPGHQTWLAGVAHVDSYLQSLGGEICLILPPSERTCRRLSQDVVSRETLRNRKVINTKSAR